MSCLTEVAKDKADFKPSGKRITLRYPPNQSALQLIFSPNWLNWLNDREESPKTLFVFVKSKTRKQNSYLCWLKDRNWKAEKKSDQKSDNLALSIWNGAVPNKYESS